MKTMLFALAMFAGGQVQAQTQEPVDTPVPASAAVARTEPTAPATVSADEKKVCRLERELGSNRAKRICHTRAELDADSAAARAALSDAQRGH